MSKDKMVTVIVLNGPPNCVDEHTEFLTQDGWKSIRDYSGEDIFVYTKEGEGRFEKPSQYIKGESETKMISFTSNKADMVLTENHRVIYKTGKTGALREKTAGDFYNILTKNKCGFDGKIPTTFNICCQDYPISDDELRFIVMYSADGTLCDKETGLSRIRVKHQYKKDRVATLLKAAGYDVGELEYSDEYSIYTFYTKVPKGLPNFFYMLSERQLAIVSKELVFWDGDCKSIYRTTKKHEADIAQFVFSSQGCMTQILTDNRIGKSFGDSLQYTRKSICYTVSQSGIGRSGFGMEKLNVEHATGVPYCFTTSTGMWLARRNNKVFVTGNSGKDYIAEVLQSYIILNTGLNCSILKYKSRLYRITAALYGLDEIKLIEVANNRILKEAPMVALGGLSPRKALIKVSEGIVKPIFGERYFGAALASSIGSEDFVVIPDGGFSEEVVPLVECDRVHRIVVVRLTADGCTFEGDSRSYIRKGPSLKDVSFLDYHNRKDGNIDDLVKMLGL